MAIEPALAGQWYGLNMREGQREAEIARNRQFTVGHTIRELNSIRAPTLLMWGEANRNLPLDQVRESPRKRARLSGIPAHGGGGMDAKSYIC